MARDAMPPMVVSSNRYFDVEPYCNRLRESDPIKWGSTFPWEFPQNAEKVQEEAFLRKFFTAQEIHVQGGAGNKDEPGAGYRFLKQVWYTQAIFNWEQRVPAFIDWWFKNAEAAVYIHDPSMRRFILAPEATLTTFFQTEEIQAYGKKFLRQVYPMIQQAARARIEVQKHGISKKDVPNDLIARSVAQVQKPTHFFEPPTAAFEAGSDMPTLTKTSSQPADARPKMLSPVETRCPAPHSAAPEPGRPRVISNGEPSQTELSTFNRKRSDGDRRYSNRSGLNQSNTPPHLQMPDTMGVYAYRSVSDMSMNPYQGHPHLNHVQYPNFAPVIGHGPPAGPPSAHLDPAYGMQAMPPGQHPARFNGSFEDMQPPVVWAQNPFALRDNGFARRPSLENGRGKARAFRGGYEHQNHESRGDNSSRAFTGDRGRGRGRGRGRNSFGSQGQAPVYGLSRTTHEFKSIDPGFELSTRVTHPSVVSVEKNWRSGSEHPQDLLSSTVAGNVKPPRFVGKYVPAPDAAALGFDPAFQRLDQVPNPSRATQHLQTACDPRNDPRHHCTQHAIGDLCQYANKLTVCNIPVSVNENEVIRIFQQFGPVQSFCAMNGGPSPTHPLRYPREHYMGFICFETVDDARRCLMNRSQTWPTNSRPVRVEVPKEYWDPSHKKYLMHRNSVPSAPPVPQQSSIVSIRAKGAVGTHQSHDSSSTVRGSTVDTTEPPSGLEEEKSIASSTSTPKKCSKSSIKSKGRNGKVKDMDKNSLATSKLSNSNLELSTNEITPASDHTPSINDSTPTVKNDKLRSAFEVTERQTVSEPSDTPADEVVAKLHFLGGKVEDVEPSTASAADVASVTTWEELHRNLDSQTSPKPLLAAPKPASINISLDVNSPDQLFREGEAKKATPSETYVTDAGGPQKEIDVLTEDVTVTPVKAEDEHVDDSFHTATGSPSTPKDSTRKCGNQMKTEPEETATPSTQSSLNGGVAKSRVDTEESEAKQIVGSVDDEQISKTTSLPVDRQPLSKNQQRKLASAKRSASSGGSLNPPVEFMTAPNTPYIEQESDKPVATADASAPPPRKIEKKKGPAATESFSQFGKRQEKKPKQQKKGTLKGKPKGMQNVADAASDASPHPSKPSSEAGVALPAERRAEKKDDSREKSAKQVPASARQDNIASEGNDESVSNRDSTLNELGCVLLPTTDEQVKHRGPLFRLGRFFTGQKSQNTPEEKQGTSSDTTRSSLTDLKAPKNNPERDDRAEGQGHDVKLQSPVDGAVKSIEADAERATDADSVGTNSSRTISGDAGGDHRLADAGLGITNIDGADKKSETKSKKKKPKKKKKTKQPAEEVDEFTPEAIPEPETASTSHQFFRGDGKDKFNFRCHTPDAVRSARSYAPPNTFGEASPSTGNSTPIVSKQPRKIHTAGSKGLVEEKRPKWKNKKRLHRGTSGAEEFVNSSDEESKNYELESVNPNGNTGPFQIQVIDTSSMAGTDTTPRSIVLIPGSRVVLLFPSQNGSNDERAGDNSSHRIEDVTDDIVEVNEVLQDGEKGDGEGKWKNKGEGTGEGVENTTVKEGKRKMQLLLEQESSRKYGQKGVSAVEVEGERMTGEEKAKVEAVRKLYPGRPIVFAQLIDESTEDV